MTPGYSRGNYHVTAGNTLSVHAVADLSDVLVCAAVSEAGADVVRAHLQVRALLLPSSVLDTVVEQLFEMSNSHEFV